MSVPEAKIAQTENGRVVQTEGWFVLNAADALWVQIGRAHV